MSTFIILVGVYCIGVILAIILLAWANAKYDTDMSAELSLLSWLIILWIIFVFVTSPLFKLYMWFYNKFKNNRRKKNDN